MVSVPRLIHGGTVLCVASGPSLVDDDVAFCRDKVDLTVVVNDNYQKAPWADVLYACDYAWWQHHQGVPSFQGLKFSLGPHPTPSVRRPTWPDVQLLQNTGESGLERDPSGVRTGRNSGYQAINLAVHLGASRIVLLGYDMQLGPRGQRHWFGNHAFTRSAPICSAWVPFFTTLVAPLKAAGVDILNCSRATSLRCFPCRSLRDVLAVAA